MDIKKILTLLVVLFTYTVGYADSLERFINRYKEKDGAVYYVFNKDRHFNDTSEGMSVSMGTQRIVSGAMALMGVEEMVSLRLDSCTENVRERFTNRIYDAIPNDYSLLAEKNRRHVYMSNSEEEYAYILVVNNERPGLTLFYVTSAFVRAVMNDEGDGVDMDKFERYVEQRLERLEESLQGSGERVRKGLERFGKHLQERMEEWGEEYEHAETYTF